MRWIGQYKIKEDFPEKSEYLSVEEDASYSTTGAADASTVTAAELASGLIEITPLSDIGKVFDTPTNIISGCNLTRQGNKVKFSID